MIREPSEEDRNRVQAREIFSTLSNEDALRIFSLAASGIHASKTVIREHDFSKKRYYVRLKELVEIGLVTKENGAYVHTQLGRIIYESQVVSLQRILTKKDSFDILTELKKRNRSNQAFRSAVSSLSEQVMEDVETSIGLSSLKPVMLMKTFNEFTSHVAMMTETANSEVCIATRNIDTKIARAALTAAEKGGNIDILHNRIRESSEHHEMRPQEELPNLFSALRSNSNVRLRRRDVPYSFSIFDKKAVAMEITQPEAEEIFFLGISLQSDTIAAKLATCFQELAQGVRIDTIANTA